MNRAGWARLDLPQLTLQKVEEKRGWLFHIKWKVARVTTRLSATNRYRPLSGYRPPILDFG